ncbi:MAG: hypothetical protein OHK93_001828 [Ramalina farinacea]|uniref:DNA polymerase epsilon subunit D n=1 Tax=Ramalina farinacea TaxID=258253 RepID=A0AA43QS99_9LECA|nr:hypothetical protein [Ramalina farinacea]
MPPRKSNASAISLANEDNTAGEGTPSRGRDGINIEDLSLPRTMVQRLAKGVLPANTSITKDGITAMQKSATVFINHLASQAHESIQTNNRKTIPPQAISEALHDTEFDGFIGRVEAELRRFNEVQTGKRNDYRRKVKEGKNPSGPFEPGEFNPDEDPGQDEDDDPGEDEEQGEGVNEEGDATEEDEDDEDDEDEYPDAGHRAESLGMEDPEEEERQRRGRYGYGAVDDTSEDEDVG